MKLRHIGAVFAVLSIAILPAPARAQSESIKDSGTKMLRRVGVHLNMSSRQPIDPDVTKGTTVGVSVGVSPNRINGWIYPFGFATFSEDLHSPSGQTFAALRSTAIVAGIGYGWHVGRLSTAASLQTGYAFNHGRANGEMPRAFEVSTGAVSLSVDNSPIVRPQVDAEYFLTPKITFRVSADYMMLRPAIAVTTPTERIVDRWHASNVHAIVGVGFYPLRK